MAHHVVNMFKEILKLSDVRAGETLAVLSEGTVRTDYAPCFLAAAQDLGANVFHLNLPSRAAYAGQLQFGKSGLVGNRAAIESLKSADIVIDLVGLLFSHEQNEITASGTRMLLVSESIEVLRQMFPDESLKRRVKAAGEILAKGRQMHITSKHGTDIRYTIGQYPVLVEYGFADEPGRWDHWPSGFLLTNGNDGGVDGTIVLMPGDIIAAFKRYVETPVTLVVEKGYVVDIHGHGMEGPLLRSYIESFNDPRAYAVSHIGWGMNEKANWFHMATSKTNDRDRVLNGLAFYGNVLFSMGPNSEVGGDNDTMCHIDMPMRDCSLTLDGQVIVQDGNLVPDELRAPGR
ncbi:MAG: leucyl aminopeptidase [Pararhizobium sp.]